MKSSYGLSLPLPASALVAFAANVKASRACCYVSAMKCCAFLGVFTLLPLASTIAVPERSLSATEYANSATARSFDKAVAAIERSEPQGWSDLASHAYRVDGEYGEAFDAACSYLARRDPTVFLRRYLAGDTNALFCGWAAYRGSGEYRSVLDAVYRYRLLEARSAAERRQVLEFTACIHDQSHLPPQSERVSQKIAPDRRTPDVHR